MAEQDESSVMSEEAGRQLEKDVDKDDPRPSPNAADQQEPAKPA